MSLKHVILGLVSREDLSGYEIKKRLKTATPNLWAVSDGQLYPMLKTLVREELLHRCLSGAGDGRRFYGITDAGQAALHAWLRNPDHESSDLKDKFLMRLLYFDRLDRAEVQRHIDRQRRELRRALDGIYATRRAYQPGASAFQRTLLDYGVLMFEGREMYLRLLEKHVREGKLTRTEPLVSDETLARVREGLRALAERWEVPVELAA